VAEPCEQYDEQSKRDVPATARFVRAADRAPQKRNDHGNGEHIAHTGIVGIDRPAVSLALQEKESAEADREERPDGTPRRRIALSNRPADNESDSSQNCRERE